MMRKSVLVWLGGLLVVILACNWPGRATPSGSQNAAQTAAAMTVQAILAASSTPAGQVQPPSPPPSVTPPPQATWTPAPSPTQAPTWTPSPEPCNRAQFVRDVTVPDGTEFAPGTAFTKTWRLKNVGTCTWQNYSLVFDHGDAMGGPPSQPIPVVAPGQEVDISVDLVAPNSPGAYRGYWRLRDNQGRVFGLTTGVPFWVDIKVVNPTATPTATFTTSPTLPPPAMLLLDFYERAPDAYWYNGHSVHLPFPGANNDHRGFARYADGLLLEDGHTYPRVLETHPEWEDDGKIMGRYPAVTLAPNAHFRAKIGFIALADGSCGAGEVEFKLGMRIDGNPTHTLATWHKDCTGALQSVDVDLSAYAGHSAVFYLRVDAAGSSAQDWAVWVNPNIATP